MNKQPAPKHQATPRNLRISLIGAGKVGQSLTSALQRERFNAVLINKDPTAQLKSAEQADIILITVQDRHIKDVCDHIAPSIQPNTIVGHCSGALSNAVLLSAQQSGAIIGSAHPLNTFPNIDAAKKLLNNSGHQTHCFISGDERAQSAFAKLFKDIGFITCELDDEAKTSYHTAGVFLCNYLTSLAEMGLQVAESAGLDRDEFWTAVQPLMQSTLSNISKHGTTASLSGPIARGDVATVSAHLEALSTNSNTLSDAYRALGQQAVELALTKANLTSKNLQKADVIEKIKSIKEVLK